MNPTTHSVYKLEIFTTTPKDYEGKLFSFSAQDKAFYIDVSSDPFVAIKEAACLAVGSRCGLITECPGFFSELFESLYQSLSLLFLEVKQALKSHTASFLSKKEALLSLVDFPFSHSVPVIMIGKGSSLNDEIDLIKAYQDKAFIVAAYSALPFLNHRGVVADLAFAMDPCQKLHEARGAKRLMIAAKTPFEIASGFEKVSLFPEDFCQFSHFIFQNTPHAPVYGYTICDTAIKYLHQKGFKEFYLSGIDLKEEGGLYVDGTECGFKPDFKKAYEHLENLASSGVILKSIKEFKPLDQIVCKTELEESFCVKELVEAFEKSLDKLKKLDFQSLGLYEMLELENEPFYRVVLEPLYEKHKLFNKEDTLDKRVFFESIMKQYE